MIQFASVLPSCLASIHPPEVIVFLIQRHRDQLLAAPRYILRRNPKHKWLGGWNNKKTPSFWLFVGPYVEISGCVLAFFCLLVWVFFFGLKCCWKTKKKINEKNATKASQQYTFLVSIKGLWLGRAFWLELPRSPLTWNMPKFDRKDMEKICVSWIIIVCQLWLK